MKFGKTWRQKQEDRQIELAKLLGKVKVFAWFPVQLNDLSWAWLEYVMADHGVYKNSYGQFDILYRKPIYYPITCTD